MSLVVAGHGIENEVGLPFLNTPASLPILRPDVTFLMNIFENGPWDVWATVNKHDKH